MSRKRNGDDERLPLLDELNELIDKERTLLSLKLLAQQSETEIWKSKYDTLLDQVNTGGNASDGALHTLEAAADIESQEQIESISTTTVQRLLIDRTSSWALDLNGVAIDKSLFAKIVKDVFGARSSFDGINSVYMSKCGLTDECLPSLISMIRSSRLQALDVSHNEFSDLFFVQLLAVLQERRCTPQYLLIEDNPPMSATTRHFESLLDVLTEHTWGLTTSLQDFADTAQQSAQQKPTKKAAAAARKELNYGYKEITKQPLVVHDFLRAFNAKLDPGHAPASAGKLKATKKVNPTLMKGAALGRFSGLHSMTVFGLKHCQISKRSVELLGVTLRHLAPTLTDLDLSFAYIGYPGAQMLRTVLGDAECQIVRLSLVGNALGDAGVLAMDLGLKANKTLTYLDLRSNSLSGKSLTVLSSTVFRSAVLHTLDLRGNLFGLEDSLAFSRHLADHGSQLFVLLDEFSANRDHDISKSGLPDLYTSLHLVKTIGPVNKMTKLHSIDVHKVLANDLGRVGDMVELRWQWRPVPLGTHTVAGQLLGNTVNLSKTTQQGGIPGKFNKSSAGTGRNKLADSDNSAYFRLGSCYFAAWEVRVVVDNHEVSVFSRVAAPGSCVTRTILDRCSPWVACSVALPCLPPKATIDLYVSCTDSSAAGGSGSGHQQFVAFEANGIRLLPLAPLMAMQSRGDGQEFGVDTASIVGNTIIDHNKLHFIHPSTRGMTVLRTLEWVQQDTQSMLWFDLKLITSADEGGSDRSSDQETRDHRTVGYSWIVHVLGTEGNLRKAAEGTYEGEKDQEMAPIGKEKHSLLKPWLWKRHSARLSDLRCGDVVVLAAKASSLRPGYPVALLANCSVAVKDCMLRDDSVISVIAASSIDDMSAFVKHDLGSIVLPV